MRLFNRFQSGDIENDSFDRRPDAARGKRAPAGKQQQEESFEESDDGIGSEVSGSIDYFGGKFMCFDLFACRMTTATAAARTVCFNMLLRSLSRIT